MVRFAIVNQLARATLAKLAALNVGAMSGAAALESTARKLMRASRGPALPGSLGAFGIGVAVGAGLGMLLAPKSGAELRAALLAKLGRKSERSGTEPRIPARGSQAASGVARPSSGGNGAGA